GGDNARFCGGEPTLHPDFLEMLDRALEKPGRDVFIMTNGLWPDDVRKQLKRLSRTQKKRITYLFNILEPNGYARGQQESLDATLKAVDSKKVTLGITLYDVAQGYDSLLALAKRHKIGHLRYSVAAPTVTEPRSWTVDPKRDFKALAKLVYRLVVDAEAAGLQVHSDCGYIPPCMFTEEELQRIHPLNRVISLQPFKPIQEFHCGGPVDIGPGGDAWRCYGLYSVVRDKTSNFQSVSGLAESFDRRTDELVLPDLFDECAECELREPYKCAGGCYGFRVVKGMQNKASAAGVSIGEDEGFLGAVPVLVQDRVRWWNHGGEERLMLLDQSGAWGEAEISEAERNILKYCDSKSVVRDLIIEVGDLSGGMSPTEIAQSIRRFYEEGMILLQKPEPKEE
ncbi:radical SAM protein, partial [Myxococcota bacterium]|nr:radical SAM protein [Myxococcota bacterium]